MLQPRVCKLQLKILHAAIKTWCREINIFLLKKKPLSGLPGCPEARTPCSQCSGGVGGRGPGFDPWSGDSVPYATPKSFHAANKAQHSQTKFFFFFFFFFHKKEKQQPHFKAQLMLGAHSAALSTLLAPPASPTPSVGGAASARSTPSQRHPSTATCSSPASPRYVAVGRYKEPPEFGVSVFGSTQHLLMN